MKASETNEQISCEKSKDEKLFECNISTYKTNQKVASKSTRQRNILTHADTVTELLLKMLTIQIISQNVTAHTAHWALEPREVTLNPQFRTFKNWLKVIIFNV